MYWILLILGVIAAVVGLTLLSNATQGVGIIALGCFLAIVARIVQAEAHERGRRHERQVLCDAEAAVDDELDRAQRNKT